MADDLQQLHLHQLYLEVLPECVRKMNWQQLSAVQRVGLTVEGPGPKKLVLEDLPSGPELYIKLHYLSCKDAYISWEALLKAGAKVMIHIDKESALHLTPPGDIHKIQALSMPWQLSISYTEDLYGLPPSLACQPGTYFWQNKAAASAGWVQPEQWDDGERVVQWSSFS